MFKNKPYNELTDKEKIIYNYDRRQYRNKQAEFERKKILSCSRLGFSDIEQVTEAVIDRLSPKTTHNHRPNLFDDNYDIAPIRRIK